MQTWEILIQKAFRNVDDILSDIGLEETEANQRAVRILGYNQIEITQESVAEMKAADEQVQRIPQPDAGNGDGDDPQRNRSAGYGF